MNKKRLELVVMVVILMTLAKPVWAAKWHLDLGLGYGNCAPSIKKTNEFIGDFNSWTQSNLGLTDFSTKKLKTTGPIYNLGLKIEPGPLWEVRLDLNLWTADEVEVSQTVGEVEIYNYYSAAFAYLGLVIHRFFMPESKLSPYVGGGIGYFFGAINADFDVYQNAPPYANLFESSSASGSTIGYILSAGLRYLCGKHFRIDLELRYNMAKISGDVDGYNEGFSSLPIELGSFKEDISGLSESINLMLRF